MQWRRYLLSLGSHEVPIRSKIRPFVRRITEGVFGDLLVLGVRGKRGTWYNSRRSARRNDELDPRALPNYMRGAGRARFFLFAIKIAPAIS